MMVESNLSLAEKSFDTFKTTLLHITRLQEKNPKKLTK